MPLERNRALLLAIAGIAIVLVADLTFYRATTAADAAAPPLQFSAARARLQLQHLVGNGVAHPVGSAANAAVRNVIVERLSGLGYSPELESGFACNDRGECATVINIIARLDDALPVENAVLLASHYDSVPAGPGASDDGAGVASMLEIARILKLSPPQRHPVVLLITDAEESGLLGASYFVSNHPLARKIKAVVNMDARGNSGLSLMFETGSANSWIIPRYGAWVTHPVTNSIFYTIYKMLPNGTDFTVFKSAGYQGVNLAFVGGVSRYHTPQDSIANVSLNTLQNQGDNALASLKMLAAADRLDAPASESIFFDILGRTVISWPASAALPLALAVATLLLAEAIWLSVKGVLNFRTVVWSVAALLATLLAALAACGCFLFVLKTVGRMPPIQGYSWIAHPLPMEIACVALAMLACAGCAASLTQRVTAWSLWFIAALFMNALNIALSRVLPGTTFITLLTSAAAVAAALPACIEAARLRMPGRSTGEFSLALPVLTYFAVLIPSLLLLYSALGTLAWPIITLLVALGCVLLLPQLTQATRRIRQRIIVVSAVFALAGLSLTVLLPTYTEQWPQRLNFEYWLDADAQVAHWAARPDSMHLPRSIREAAAFDSTPQPRYVGGSSLGFMAPTAPRPLAAPQLVLLSSVEIPPHAASSPALTHVAVHVQSARGAPTAFVVFPALARVRRVVIATPDGDLRTGLRELAGGATQLTINALPAAGANFSFDAAADTPLTARIYDESYELPEGSILQRARAENATSSQDGDVTIVEHTVSLDPAAGR